jgi:non-canonical poly(A) RNA polymerase PAPD5/7
MKKKLSEISENFLPFAENPSCNIPFYEEEDLKPKPREVEAERYERDLIGLHEEIQAYYRTVQPTPESHSLRFNLLHKVRSLVQSLWPQARVEPFGSFATGLYLPTSDMDIVILGQWEVLPLRTLERSLESLAKPGSVEVIHATVPLVKYCDLESNISVDISFNSLSGPQAAQVIKMFKQQFPIIPQLVSIVKQFLLERDLGQVFTGGLSSYAVTILVISFLQLHPRRDPCSDNLGVLLIEFFHLYGHDFNYSSLVVSIRDGGQLLQKSSLLPDTNINQRWSDVQGFAIEDPLQPFKDIAKGTFNGEIIKKAFALAYRRLVARTRSGSRMLESIVRLG